MEENICKAFVLHSGPEGEEETCLVGFTLHDIPQFYSYNCKGQDLILFRAEKYPITLTADVLVNLMYLYCE